MAYALSVLTQEDCTSFVSIRGIAVIGMDSVWTVIPDSFVEDEIDVGILKNAACVSYEACCCRLELSRLA